MDLESMSSIVGFVPEFWPILFFRGGNKDKKKCKKANLSKNLRTNMQKKIGKCRENAKSKKNNSKGRKRAEPALCGAFESCQQGQNPSE